MLLNYFDYYTALAAGNRLQAIETVGRYMNCVSLVLDDDDGRVSRLKYKLKLT